MSRWLKRLKMMRISKYAIVICLLLSIVFAGFTVYGANTGNFNIYVQESDVSLAVYMKDDKSDLGAHLSVSTLDQLFDCTYLFVPDDIATKGTPEKGLGSKNDPYNRYIAFSLCLVNMSDRAVDYRVAMTINDTTAGKDGGNVLGALRVALIRGDDPMTAAKFFAKPEDNVENKTYLENQLKNEYRPYPSETIDFISETQIFSEDYQDLDVNGEQKFTIVIWLEGCDVDCIDNLLSGKVKMGLEFVGR